MSSSAVELGSRTATPRAGRARRRRLTAWQRLISPIVLVIAWQGASMAGILPDRLLAAPTVIFSTAVDLTEDGTLVTATLVSLQRVAIGFVIGAVAALVFAFIAGLSRVGENALDPPLQMLRTLPHFGLIPLFILWFGIGETPKIALVTLGVVFPLYLNTFAGIRGVDPKLIEAARTLRLSRAALVRHVLIPGALPQTLVGLRQSLGIAWLALVVAETVNADAGLGYMITDAREFLRTDIIVVGLAVYSLLGLLTDAVVRFTERRALAWRRTLLD